MDRFASMLRGVPLGKLSNLRVVGKSTCGRVQATLSAPGQFERFQLDQAKEMDGDALNQAVTEAANDAFAKLRDEAAESMMPVLEAFRTGSPPGGEAPSERERKDEGRGEEGGASRAGTGRRNPLPFPDL